MNAQSSDKTGFLSSEILARVERLQVSSPALKIPVETRTDAMFAVGRAAIQYGAVVHGGFVRDCVVRNEAPRDLDLRVQDPFDFAEFQERVREDAGVDLEVPPGDAPLVCRPLPGMPAWDASTVDTMAVDGAHWYIKERLGQGGLTVQTPEGRAQSPVMSAQSQSPD